MAWNFVTDTHEPIRQVLLPYRGTEITTDRWKELVGSIPGIGSKAQFVHASDHCSNMTNEGACEICASLDGRW